jgi:hypothetical protein
MGTLLDRAFAAHGAIHSILTVALANFDPGLGIPNYGGIRVLCHVGYARELLSY